MNRRPWVYLREDGRGSAYTYLTDEQALDKLSHGIRIAPIGGAAALTHKLAKEAQ
jgi:hypothetical protein